ncbi:hypothetical protein BD289DRAFT_280439 [Coniella lustricola]|uniref:Uncharacterized protein n=1 Tax=Coniella lustricola TaxID=2025994 RepID=A0A2T3A667_9PEZI|nr:hypothetical protein BD289DRAFT_280439 [Coniella lustricola]
MSEMTDPIAWAAVRMGGRGLSRLTEPGRVRRWMREEAPLTRTTTMTTTKATRREMSKRTMARLSRTRQEEHDRVCGRLECWLLCASQPEGKRTRRRDANGAHHSTNRPHTRPSHSQWPKSQARVLMMLLPCCCRQATSQPPAMTETRVRGPARYKETLACPAMPYRSGGGGTVAASGLRGRFGGEQACAGLRPRPARPPKVPLVGWAWKQSSTAGA